MTSRRSFLAVVALAPFAALAAGRAGAQIPACYDPAQLPLSQKSLRASLKYVDAAPDQAKKRCGLCAFFTGAQAGCGTCVLLSGGAVNATGVCNNFAPKG